MAKRPSFQFYPADWRNNAKLRRCSWAARGVWIELLGLLHDSDEYGILRWPLKEVAQAIGAPVKELNELVTKGVLYGCASGVCEEMVYVPRSGRKEGEPVVLVPAQAGPIWYSPRMVRDEYKASIRGNGSRFGAPEDDAGGESNGASPNTPPKGGFGESNGAAPNRRQGDGSSSTSSSSKEKPPKSPRGGSSAAVNFETWFSGIPEGVDAISEEHHVWTYAERVGLPHEFVALAWAWFKAKYLGEPRKRYIDWPAHFRKAVEGGYGNLWRIDAEGQYFLTTQGKQLQRSLDAEDDDSSHREAA